ncbi:MAG: FG-GAP-like repeat-containing protein [Candidatus Eisenbacteria bacterium]
MTTRQPREDRVLAPLILAVTFCVTAGAANAAAPDLIAVSVDAGSVVFACADAHATGTVSATVRNDGDATSGPFWVRFFEDRNHNGAYNAGTDLSLGERRVTTSLAPGAQAVATLSINATFSFARDRVHAWVDSHQEIGESSEANNVANSGDDCAFTPGVGTFNPAIEWAWTASDVDPLSINVLMTPSVIDLNGDTIPDVVFGSTSSLGGGYLEPGILRAISGSNGAELFAVTDPAYTLNVAASIATGDLDGDGWPEIIAVDETGTHLLCFENDGTYKWTSDEVEQTNWGAPAIADLNQDGTPEIVLGRQALDANGTLLWTGTGGRGQFFEHSPLSLVADVDLDGSPDVVAGNTVYSAVGAIEYQNLDVHDGLCAVANFDADPEAEIVVVYEGQLWLLNHDCSIAWGPVEVPGAGGGAPTVADYDGDGLPEIGIAGFDDYTVFENDGTVKWSSPVQDHSSYTTGSSVFDFDGDGSAEVVYRDETTLRIYRGSDGFVLYQIPMSSCTWHEYVLVADVDADGNAEIIAVANQNCGVGPEQGIYVIGDADDSWVSTRRIWNQYSYHITNVNDDGSIPAVEANNWLTPGGQPFNNYRQNSLPGNEPLAASNLTASRVQVDRSYCPAQLGLVARIGNGGSNVAAAPVNVAYYDGDPNGGGTLLGVAATSINLPPGEFEDVTLLIPSSLTGTHSICVAVDDGGSGVGSVHECDETDNLCCVNLALGPCNMTEVGDGAIAAGAPYVHASPIPARTSVLLTYELPPAGTTDITIIDAAGRAVRSFHQPGNRGGRQVLAWDLRDDDGRRVRAGIYAYRVQSGPTRLTGKLVIVP